MAAVSKRLRKVGVDANGKNVYKQTGWQVRYVDPDGAERRRSFTTQKAAQRFANEVEVHKNRGTYIDPAAGKVTFEEYAEEWRKVQPWRPGTAETTRLRLEKYVYPELGAKPIASIRRTDVQAMVKKTELSMNGRKVNGEAQPLATSTVHAIAAAAQAVFLAAVEDQVIAVSPANKLTLPNLDDADLDDEGEVKALTPKQFQAFEAALPDRFKIAAWIGLGTGMRIGEVCGLTVDRVDFLRRRIRVNRQMLASGRFGPPKTKASRRWIPLSAELATRIAEHIKKYPDVVEGRGLIISGPRGASARDALLEATAAAAKKAGMSDRQRFHSLRHTFASNLISAGKSIKVVQKLLGHAKIQETLDTYGHMLPEDEGTALDAIDAALSEFSIGPSSAHAAVDNSEGAGGGPRRMP